ncbi:hypothetical protein R0J90_21885, partial [Micrococcus sp. SIMBA_144]
MVAASAAPSTRRRRRHADVPARPARSERGRERGSAGDVSWRCAAGGRGCFSSGRRRRRVRGMSPAWSLGRQR